MSAQFILGIVGTIIAAAMVWLCSRLFNKRQLYVISENLYKNSLLTDKGIVCEISIFNRGRQIEEDIELTLDNNLSYELLAYNDSNASLDNNIIKINRLHQKSKVGILLLIEQGEFSYKKIHKVESKTEKGRVVEKLAEVPMNYVDLILVFVFFLLFIGLGGVGGYLFRDMYNEISPDAKYKTKQEYTILEKIGWSNLESYFESSLSKSYHGSEFPIRYIKRDKLDNKIIYTFEIYNKTTLPMDITVDVANKTFMQETELGISTYEHLSDIPPLSKAILKTEPIPINKFKELEFSLKTIGTSYDKTDFIYDLTYKFD